MLAQRILTALVLIPLVLWGVFAATDFWFASVLGIILLLGAWEWAKMAGLNSIGSLLYLALLAVLFYGAQFLPPVVILSPALLWWSVAIGLVITYPKYHEFWQQSLAVRLFAGLGLLIPTFVALICIRDSGEGAWDLVYLMLLIWGADSAAYFSGRRFGHRKLAPKLSPGKTWEGFIGAQLAGLFIAIWSVFYFEISFWFALVLAVTVVTISVVGDLFESLAKRESGVKDSGHILPGHGGVMDRIDSLTAAAPLFSLFWMYQP
ncbi:MAG TPA: phosphatidate cytidylyltransferase [Gammaproteobacteria bacterium]|nr:phosphatidate cytidylyltransferase [Gammaproteobacteria bacterium]